MPEYCSGLPAPCKPRPHLRDPPQTAHHHSPGTCAPGEPSGAEQAAVVQVPGLCRDPACSAVLCNTHSLVSYNWRSREWRLRAPLRSRQGCTEMLPGSQITAARFHWRSAVTDKRAYTAAVQSPAVLPGAASDGQYQYRSSVGRLSKTQTSEDGRRRATVDARDRVSSDNTQSFNG